jgi:hypothetical protein
VVVSGGNNTALRIAIDTLSDFAGLFFFTNLDILKKRGSGYFQIGFSDLCQ